MLPPRLVPSWAWLSVQSSVRPAGIARYRLSDPTSAVAFGARPVGLPSRPSRANGLVFTHAPLVGFRRPPGSCPDDACCGLSATAPSMDFPPLWHVRNARSGSRGLYLPATFRPQGLITLSTVFSLAQLVGLISCRQRPWGFPFGAFSSSKVSRRLRRNAPRLPLPLDPTRPTEVCTVETEDPASGFILERIPREQAGCLARQTAGCSLGFCPFQGS
jgi:hypothetical protein